MVTHCGCKNKRGGEGRGCTTRGQCEFNDKKQVPLFIKSNLRDFPTAINSHSITPPPLLISAQRCPDVVHSTILFCFDFVCMTPNLCSQMCLTCWYAFNCGHEWLDCSHHLKVCKRAEGSKQEGWCLNCPAEWWSQTASSYILDIADILWLQTQHVTL